MRRQSDPRIVLRSTDVPPSGGVSTGSSRSSASCERFDVPRLRYGRPNESIDDRKAPVFIAAVMVMVVSTTLLLGAFRRVRISRVGPARHNWTEQRVRRWTIGSLIWTVLVGALLALYPGGETRSATPIGSDQARTARRSNLIETEGYSVLALLLFPIVVAAVAVIARPGRWQRQVRIACATLLAAFCVLGIASVGFPYVPAALAILRAGSRTESIAARR